MTLNRRQLIAGATAAATLSGVLARDLQKLRINLIPITDVAPVYAGVKHGFFKEAGFDPVMTPSTGGATGIPGLIGGAFDVIYANPVSTILAVSRGIDVRVLSSSTGLVSTTSGLFGRKGEGLKTGKALEGKSIAVNTRSNSIWLFAYSWVRETGGDPEKVQFKEVPFPQMLDAVRQKQVDAAFSIAPFFTRAKEDPTLEILGYPFDLQPQIEPGLYLCSGKSVKETPEVINGFVAGLKRSNSWYDEHLKSPELDQLIADYTKLPVETVASIGRKPAFSSVSLAELDKTMRRMIDARMLDKPVELSRAIYHV